MHIFIEHLPQEYAYYKFILIVICYLLIMALSIFLISECISGLIIFLALPITMLLIGALFLKDEIKHELKWERNR